MMMTPNSTWTRLLGAFLVCGLAGCQQVMSHEPYYRPMEPSKFFADGRSARPFVEGAVARGQLRTDLELYEGKRNNHADVVQAVGIVSNASAPFGAAAPYLAGAGGEYVDDFPFRITEDLLHRGQQRFNIYCSVCHGRTGTGDGKIVQRGYTRPPSYITDYSRGYERRGVKLLLRDAPVGYFFGVITHGYGAMADYSVQVAPEDRWAIIAYIRALQLSQHAPVDQLPKQDSEKFAADSIRKEPM
jgi:mono/diheme cytochrome c family protein